MPNGATMTPKWFAVQKEKKKKTTKRATIQTILWFDELQYKPFFDWWATIQTHLRSPLGTGSVWQQKGSLKRALKKIRSCLRKELIT